MGLLKDLSNPTLPITESTTSLGNPFYYLTTHFSLLLLIILQERVRNSLKWNPEIYYQQDFFFLSLFFLHFRLLQRNTATLSSQQRWRAFGGTWRMHMPGMNSPTPVQQTKKLSKPMQMWPSGLASPNWPQQRLSIPGGFPFYRHFSLLP